MIFIRLAGLFFAVVQITLALRLLLPFVEVPLSLEEYVPTLLQVTDLWLAPFAALVDQLDILGTTESLATAAGVEGVAPEEFEAVVVVAMVGWAVIAMFGLFVLRLIFRPVG
ncbi:hypothetical protein BH23CHL8_BH23CHL8_11410 [soil metagenome]